MSRALTDTVALVRTFRVGKFEVTLSMPRAPLLAGEGPIQSTCEWHPRAPREGDLDGFELVLYRVQMALALTGLMREANAIASKYGLVVELDETREPVPIPGRR